MIDLQELIEYTKKNQIISWNNKSLIQNIEEAYRKYLTNFNFPNHGQVHGYFTLIHNLVKRLPNKAIIVELGNREGMSTLAIYDALKPTQKFYTIDIMKDLRIIPKSFFKDNRVNVIYGDCTKDEIVSSFEDESIDFLFSDTIHYYDQINKEFKAYKSKMKNGSVIFVDDIELNDKRKFFEEWEGEKYSMENWCHETGFGCFFVPTLY